MCKIRPFVQNTAFWFLAKIWHFQVCKDFASPIVMHSFFIARDVAGRSIYHWSWLKPWQQLCKRSQGIEKVNTHEKVCFQDLSKIRICIQTALVCCSLLQWYLNFYQASPQNTSVSLPDIGRSRNLGRFSYIVLLLLTGCRQGRKNPIASGRQAK